MIDRRHLLIAGSAAGLGLGWWQCQAPSPEAPPDRAETEEMMREIGYLQ